ncbi:MAG TPA: SDR family oxidoreductase [Gemmatimonadales bacterium]|jgi:putative NADH-flavin reductase
MAPKKLLVLGATGPTGRQVVTQALEQGHQVTAFVRDPKRLPVEHAHLRVLTGDVTDSGPALPAAVRGQDVVVSALGVGLSLKSRDLIARAVPKIVAAMEAQRVSRLIFTSAYGVGSTWIDVPPLARIMIRLLLRDVYADKAAGEEVLQRSQLDWTLVYPVALTNGPRTGRYQVGERLALKGLPRVSRADLAAFLLAQVEDPTYIRKGVLISS